MREDRNSKDRERYAKDPEFKARKQLANRNRLDDRNRLSVLCSRKYYTLKTNAKRRGIEFVVKASDLKKVWEDQQGKCAITGRPLIYQGPKLHLNSPSVDRIDPSKGYTPDNIQWMVFQANVSMSVGGKGELIEFCKDVLRHSGFTWNKGLFVTPCYVVL